MEMVGKIIFLNPFHQEIIKKNPLTIEIQQFRAQRKIKKDNLAYFSEGISKTRCFYQEAIENQKECHLKPIRKSRYLNSIRV